MRSNDEDVAFICGSDEHGAAITLRAKKDGKLPKDIVNIYHNSNKEVFEKLGISFDIYDIYIRGYIFFIITVSYIYNIYIKLFST